MHDEPNTVHLGLRLYSAVIPIFRKHAVAIRRVFAVISLAYLEQLEKTLKQVGRRAATLDLDGTSPAAVLTPTYKK